MSIIAMLTKNKIDFIKKVVSKKLCEKVIEVSFLERGACSNIFLIKTGKGNLYCLKEERLNKFDVETNNLLIEAKIIKLLESKNIALIPKIIFTLNNPKMFCYKYIDGVPLDSKWGILSEKKRIIIMRNIGKYHGELYNKTPLVKAKAVGIKRKKDDFAHLTSIILSKFKMVGSGKNGLFKQIKEIRQIYNQSNVNDSVYSFLHGDLHRGNLLIYKGKLKGIVDFGDSQIGDVHKDFGHHARHYPKYINYVIEGFEAYTGLKLSKNKIICYALLKDLEKLVYHVNKYELGRKKLESKIDTVYNKFLETER